MKALPIAASAALLLLAVGPAIPQSVQAPAISTLRCSDIASADAAYQAALVYYAAGYRDGADYAMALNSTTANQASSALSAMASNQVASAPASGSATATGSGAGSITASSAAAASTNASSSAAAAPILGGLTLQAQDVITACKSSPNALVTDIVANRGGGTGFKGTPGGAPGAAAGGAGGTTLPNTSGGAGGAAAGASGAATASGAGATVSNIVQGVSQQIQQGISSTAPGGAGATGAGTPAASSP